METRRQDRDILSHQFRDQQERERTISRETEVGETQREKEPLRKRGMVGERNIGIERERQG